MATVRRVASVGPVPRSDRAVDGAAASKAPDRKGGGREAAAVGAARARGPSCGILRSIDLWSEDDYQRDIPRRRDSFRRPAGV